MPEESPDSPRQTQERSEDNSRPVGDLEPSSSKSSVDEVNDDDDEQSGAWEPPPDCQNRSPSPVAARVEQEKDREYH